jgi:hypothetical protein
MKSELQAHQLTIALLAQYSGGAGESGLGKFARESVILGGFARVPPEYFLWQPLAAADLLSAVTVLPGARILRRMVNCGSPTRAAPRAGKYQNLFRATQPHPAG